MSSKKQPAKGPGNAAGGSNRGRQGYSVGTSKRGRAGARRAPGRPGVGGGGGRGRLIAVVAAVVAVIAIGVGAFVLLGGEDDAYAEALTAAGCVDETIPEMADSSHLAEGEEPPEYNSNPPTSGRHQPVPALWGVYDSPVGQDILIHNLEHGGLIVQYGDGVPPETRTAMVEAVLEDRDFMLITPYPALGDKVAFTMWTRLVVCERFDVEVMNELRKSRNQAPAPEVPQDPTINRQPGF
jgi:Protein of unknown function (DUF3105)